MFQFHLTGCAEVLPLGGEQKKLQRQLVWLNIAWRATINVFLETSCRPPKISWQAAGRRSDIHALEAVVSWTSNTVRNWFVSMWPVKVWRHRSAPAAGRSAWWASAPGPRPHRLAGRPTDWGCSGPLGWCSAHTGRTSPRPRCCAPPPQCPAPARGQTPAGTCGPAPLDADTVSLQDDTAGESISLQVPDPNLSAQLALPAIICST